MKKWIRALGATALCAGLMACGGGGGGGGGRGGPVADEGRNGSRVWIGSITPAAVTRTYQQSSPYRSIDLTATFGGDPNSVAGEVLYVFVVDANMIVEPVPSATLTDDGVIIGLNVKAGLPPGQYDGVFDVHACLDPQCIRQFGNSPTSVPYSIRVAATP